MSKIEITDLERDLLRQALGLNRIEDYPRNYIITWWDDPEDVKRAIEQLSEKGLIRGGASLGAGRGRCFHATRLGAKAAGMQPFELVELGLSAYTDQLEAPKPIPANL